MIDCLIRGYDLAIKYAFDNHNGNFGFFSALKFVFLYMVICILKSNVVNGSDPTLLKSKIN